MRRTLLLCLLSLAAVAPGVARFADGDGARPGRPGGRGDLALPPGPGSGACQADFQVDVGTLVPPPSGTWSTFTADCSATADCSHFFSFSCDPGDLVQASFCSNGGVAAFDTDLSVWNDATLEACDDDTCGQLSDVSWTSDGSLSSVLRIGTPGGTGGSYTLAVNMPATCSIGPPIAVELESLTVD